jgi:hypothetical protein
MMNRQSNIEPALEMGMSFKGHLVNGCENGDDSDMSGLTRGQIETERPLWLVLPCTIVLDAKK